MTDKTPIEIIARQACQKLGMLSEHPSWAEKERIADTLTRDIIAALKDAGYVIEPDWRPIEEAPKDGTRVLLFVPPYGPSTGHYEPARANWGPNASLWICHSVLNKEASPTRFRPLPTPPETTNKS